MIYTRKAEECAHIAAGNWHSPLFIKRTEEQIYNQEKFIQLMRLCWERKMLPVNTWVNEMHS